MGRQKAESLNIRESERDDCAHYPDCLMDAALKPRGQAKVLPCKDCPRYKPGKPEKLDAWRKRGDWNPTPL